MGDMKITNYAAKQHVGELSWSFARLARVCLMLMFMCFALLPVYPIIKYTRGVSVTPKHPVGAGPSSL